MISSSFSCRQASLDDLDILLDLEGQPFAQGWSESILRELILSQSSDEVYGRACWVLENNQSVLAWLCFSYCFESLDLEEIVVATTVQRQGLGRFFLEELLTFAKKENFKEITLECSEKNQKAKNLYKSQGFKVQGLRANYYAKDEAAILMVYHL